jgi:hypothetical protein
MAKSRTVSYSELELTMSILRKDLPDEYKPSTRLIKNILERISRPLFETRECVLWSGAKVVNQGVVTFQGKLCQLRRLLRYWFTEEFDLKNNAIVIKKTCDSKEFCCNLLHCKMKDKRKNKKTLENTRPIKKRRLDSDRGENHGGAKLTEANVREIWKMLKEGIKQSEIAKRYSVSSESISNIAHGKAWIHVTGLATGYEDRNRHYREWYLQQREKLERYKCTLNFRKDLPENRIPKRSRIIKFELRLGAPLNETDECVPFSGDSFGKMKIQRVVYDWFVGNVPQDMLVLRKCKDGPKKHCVNPKHLFLGTRSQINKKRES